MNNNSNLTKVICVVTKKVEQWINRHRIYKILCLVPDIAGNTRGVFIEVYSTVKSLEFDQLSQVVPPWKREHLLLRV